MRKTTQFLLLTCMIAVSQAHARAIRIDGGDWTEFFGANQTLGFSYDFFGFGATDVVISADGSVQLTGGGSSINVFSYVDAAASNLGFVSAYNNSFAAVPGVEQGFRVSWGSEINEQQNWHQVTFWQLSGGQTALEFNINRIVDGGGAAQIGYDGFNLLGELGLSFSEYGGSGDIFDTDTNCAAAAGDTNPPPKKPLACYNYFNGAFDDSTAILPGIAGGFFRFTDTNDQAGNVRGRYLFLSDAPDPRPVPEPGALVLLGIGLIGMGLVRSRRRVALQRSRFQSTSCPDSSRARMRAMTNSRSDRRLR